MGSLLKFSGITTKVRAMQKYLLSDADFARMRQLDSVPEAVAFLRGFAPYERILKDIPEPHMHRAVIEEQLILTEYRDFARLYQFADMKQKQFLKLYFRHFELSAIKRCLHHVETPGSRLESTEEVKQFFARYSRLDLEQLLQADTLEQFVEATKGSPYYEIFSALLRQGVRRRLDYETAGDMLYFKLMWEKSIGQLGKSERGIIEQTLGAKIDLLNLSWIYRAKKYYDMTEAEIYALLVPIRYRVKREEIMALVEAADREAFMRHFRKTYYGRMAEQELEEAAPVKDWLGALLERIYRLSYQKNPYSIACLNTYFYLKEQEIKRIIHIIEEIRYGVNQSIYEKGGGIA